MNKIHHKNSYDCIIYIKTECSKEAIKTTKPVLNKTTRYLHIYTQVEENKETGTAIKETAGTIPGYHRCKLTHENFFGITSTIDKTPKQNRDLMKSYKIKI